MEENIINNTNDVIENDTVTEEAEKGFDLSKKDFIFELILCLSSVLLTVFGIFGGFNIGFSVTSLIMFCVMTAFFISRKTKVRAFPLLCGLLNCLLSVSFTVTSNGGIRFLSVVSMLFLSAVWFVSLVTPREKENDFVLLQKIIVPFALGNTYYLPKAVASLGSLGKKGNKKLGKALLGIALSIPVLVIVVPLLISSDEAFASLMEKLFGNIIVNILKAVLGVAISVFLISYCLTVKKQETPILKSLSIPAVDTTVAVSFLSVLGICYLGYMLSQLAYFFSGFLGILPQDYSFTLSAYARRGFFEMCIISVINFVIIYFALIFSKKQGSKINLPVRIICTFIGIFNLLIIATAISKMFLYISGYGMTELRITTTAFMVFLAVVFVSVMLRLYIPNIRVLKVAFVTAGCVLFLLGTVNINSIIADYNYTAYKSGVLDEIDISALQDLGDEGIPYLVALTNDSDYEVAEWAKNAVKGEIESGKYYDVEFEHQEVYDEYGTYTTTTTAKIKGKLETEFYEYNISRDSAVKALDYYIKRTM